jgi:hypothetical protein
MPDSVPFTKVGFSKGKPPAVGPLPAGGLVVEKLDAMAVNEGLTTGGATSNVNITLFPSARNTALFDEITLEVVTLFTLPLISS